MIYQWGTEKNIVEDTIFYLFIQYFSEEVYFFRGEIGCELTYFAKNISFFFGHTDFAQNILKFN